MERKKYFLVIIFCFLLFSKLFADNKQIIYNCYLSGDMQKWKEVIDEMQKRQNKTDAYLLELINYQYGYIAWCLGEKKNKEAENYLKTAESNLKVLESRNFSKSYISAYNAAFLGFRIGLNSVRAPLLGPRSVDAAKLAIAQDSRNPFGYIQYANAQYYLSSIFGGSKKEAIEYFQKAERIMNSDINLRRNNWNYLSLLTTIANAYVDTGNLWLAKNYFERILVLEPEFSWLKNELYPELLKKLKL